MEIIFTISWFLAGAIGSTILWRKVRETKYPSPFAIIVISIGSIFGYVLLIVSLAILTVDFILDFQERDSWWTRPVRK